MQSKAYLYINRNICHVLIFLLLNCVFSFLCSPPTPFPFFLLLYHLLLHLFSIFLFPFSLSPPLPILLFPTFPLLSILLCSFLPPLPICCYLSPLALIVPCPRPALHCLPRYYAICCQPLVYRSKMTPVRIALMLAGCWAIPMFISFLPIMQGWNNIGIVDVVSIYTEAMGLLVNQRCWA